MSNEEFLESISLEGEVWKPVDWIQPTWYAVSNLGRIVSFSRIINKIRLGTPVSAYKPHKVMTPILRKDGYYHIKLSDGIQARYVLLHRIIAKAFIPNPNNYPYIDHIDTNPSNNDILNLRWCTASMNRRNPITQEKERRAFKGVFNNKTSKPIVQLKDGIIINQYPSMREAQRCGFSQQAISLCCSGKLKQHKGFQWMYLSDYEASNQ